MNNEKLISLGQINFINCLPVNYTFDKWHHRNIVVSNGHPAFINHLLKNELVHLAPISSIEYIKNKKDYSLIKTACISSNGEVGSVMLFSKVPFNNLNGKKIALPHTSATSSALLKVLLHEKGINCQFEIHKNQGSPSKTLTQGFDAVLQIGDSALIANSKDTELFKYDLGQLWKDLTGLPMVFGTWACWKDWQTHNQKDYNWISVLLDKAVDAGLNMYFNEVVKIATKKLNVDNSIIEDYLKNKINYKYTNQHFKALELFEHKYNMICE